jgi:hypothetical protein
MDREKVIKGMESLYDRLLDAAKLDTIAMLDASMVANAIALLKEQEEGTGHWIINEYEYLTCSLCGKSYYTGCKSTKEAQTNQKKNAYPYCPYCGKKMAQ